MIYAWLIVGYPAPYLSVKSSSLYQNLTNKICQLQLHLQIIEGSGRAHILLPNGNHLFIKNALYSSNSRRNLLSFKDIRMNEYYIETKNNKGNKEFLCTISNVGSQNLTLEKFSFSLGLYCTTINIVESHVVISQKLKGNRNQKLNDPKNLTLWHELLSHMSL